MKKRFLSFCVFLSAMFTGTMSHAGLIDHEDVTGFPNVNVDAQFSLIAKKYLPETRRMLPTAPSLAEKSTVDIWKEEIGKKAAGLNIPADKLAAFVQFVSEERYNKNCTVVPAPHPALLEFELYATGYRDCGRFRILTEMPEPWKKLLALPREERLYTTIPVLYVTFVRSGDWSEISATIARMLAELDAGCYDTQGCLLALCRKHNVEYFARTPDAQIRQIHQHLRRYTVNTVPQKRWRWTNAMDTWVRSGSRGENAYAGTMPDFLWYLVLKKEEELREIAKKDPLVRDLIVAFGLTCDSDVVKHVRKVAWEFARESEINLPILALRVPYEEAKKLLAGKKEYAALLALLTIKQLNGEAKLAAIDSYIATYPDYTPADMPVTPVALNTHLELNALAGLELLKLGRYEEALKRWLNGSTPEDAGLVAEQILTTDQLLEFCKKYTENTYRDEGFILSRHCVNGEHPFDLRIAEREYIHELVRNILARRLMRENRSAEARQWFTGPVMRASSEEYFKAEDALKNAKTDSERLDACLRMAALLRFEGDRICGTYLEPDNLICLGTYPCVWGTKMEGLKLNKPSLPRYSYRYKAAEFYRQAARYTKDRTIQAACYWSAGTLLKNIAPKVADADFKMLASIAPELTQNNWFMPLKNVSTELQGFYRREHFYYHIGGIGNLKVPLPDIPEVALPAHDSNTEQLFTTAHAEQEKLRNGEKSWSPEQIRYAFYLVGKKGDPRGYFWCGVMELYFFRNTFNALGLYQAAHAMKPDMETAIVELGTVYLVCGYINEAHAQFHKVADKPQYTDKEAFGVAAHYLAMVYFEGKNGVKRDIDKAAYYLDRAVKAGNPEAIQFFEFLKETRLK